MRGPLIVVGIYIKVILKGLISYKSRTVFIFIKVVLYLFSKIQLTNENSSIHQKTSSPEILSSFLKQTYFHKIGSLQPPIRLVLSKCCIFS